MGHFRRKFEVMDIIELKEILTAYLDDGDYVKITPIDKYGTRVGDSSHSHTNVKVKWRVVISTPFEVK